MLGQEQTLLMLFLLQGFGYYNMLCIGLGPNFIKLVIVIAFGFLASEFQGNRKSQNQICKICAEFWE